MLPERQRALQALARFPSICSASALAAALVVALPAVATAQDAADPSDTGQVIDREQAIDFEANSLSYDSQADTVTAEGNVVMSQGARQVTASRVTWDRNSGRILATGGVALVDEDGNRLYSDSVELTEEFDAGAMEDLLLALAEGARIAAERGTRSADGTIVLERAAYSPCAVVNPEGCEKEPSWRITADRVTYDPDDKRVDFKGAYLELFGARLLPLPGLSVTTDGRAKSGFMIPDFRISDSNGVEVSGTYYWKLAENRDLSLTGTVFTETAPMLSGQFRELTDTGAWQVTGYATRSSRIPIGSFNAGATDETDFRGYFYSNGKFQIDPNWSFTYHARVASDRTFLRRYDISRDDRLRSMAELEHVGDNTYFSLAGWATQTLRFNTPQGQVPLALPVMDWRVRLDDPVLGGKVQLQANTLSINRSAGQDTNRAFASARWDTRRITGMGQEVSLTALARGDVYRSDENALTQTAIYRGEPGWQTRGFAIGAVDVKWPFIGEAFGGTQVLTPRFQIVASPQIRNLAIPNEDSRAIDLEDSNLFALNRFPGYDRIEDGVRFTYGFDWLLTRPDWRVKTTVGQSYRLTSEPTIFPDGTGLTNKTSDIVGRTEVRFRDFVSLTHRYRLDKDSLGVRRNELDATVGSRRTYAEIGYLRLNRDIDDSIEDLQDREELRLAGRVAFANYWSVFGSAVINLTNEAEDPTFVSDGFEPLRTRLGVAYEDDCLELGLTWRRDYTATGDAERGNTFQVHVALRNLGFNN